MFNCVVPQRIAHRQSSSQPLLDQQPGLADRLCRLSQTLPDCLVDGRGIAPDLHCVPRANDIPEVVDRQRVPIVHQADTARRAPVDDVRPFLQMVGPGVRLQVADDLLKLVATRHSVYVGDVNPAAAHTRVPARQARGLHGEVVRYRNRQIECCESGEPPSATQHRVLSDEG